MRKVAPGCALYVTATEKILRVWPIWWERRFGEEKVVVNVGNFPHESYEEPTGNFLMQGGSQPKSQGTNLKFKVEALLLRTGSFFKVPG
jgi:hypothetical protein